MRDAKTTNCIEETEKMRLLIFRLVFIICLLSLAAVTPAPQAWRGWAEKDCVCLRPYDPICASDMRRYYNACVYKCRLKYLADNNMPMIKTVDCKILPPTIPT